MQKINNLNGELNPHPCGTPNNLICVYTIYNILKNSLEVYLIFSLSTICRLMQIFPFQSNVRFITQKQNEHFRFTISKWFICNMRNSIKWGSDPVCDLIIQKSGYSLYIAFSSYLYRLINNTRGNRRDNTRIEY